MKHISGFILLIVALLVGGVIIPVGFIYGLIKSFWHSHIGNGLEYENRREKSVAIRLDEFVNAACPELFEDCLMKVNGKYHFGISGQTLSLVIGLNQIENNLTKTGIIVCRLLNLFERDHCLKYAVQYLNQIKQ